ncbi:hypothetical protein [[Eubacterium] cellulosolvens]
MFMKKLPSGTGWLIGGIIGISYMVLILFFEPDLLVPIGVGGGLVSAWAIGFALEGQKKKLTDKQENRIRSMIVVGIILLVIFFLFGIIFFLQ